MSSSPENPRDTVDIEREKAQTAACRDAQRTPLHQKMLEAARIAEREDRDTFVVLNCLYAAQLIGCTADLARACKRAIAEANI